jgi:thiamine pyrophosphate-dependent acetolactate synthase large subunit-like protein
MNGQAFQNIQSAAGGVKFGALVVVTGQAQAATAQDAQQLADTVKLLANLAQMQAGNDPIAASLAQSLTVSTSGTTVNASVSLPEDQLQQAVKPKTTAKKHLQQKQ